MTVASGSAYQPAKMGLPDRSDEAGDVLAGVASAAQAEFTPKNTRQDQKSERIVFKDGWKGR